MRTRFLPAWIVVSLCLAVVALSAVPLVASAADPMDWPNWRGPEQNRISRETGIIDKWNPDSGENVLWKNEEAAGISSPIVMNGKVYTQVRHKPDTREEQEKVICLDAETGKKLWENRWNVYLSDVPAERVGWSSVVGDPETGKIYSLGVNGYFSCIDGETGKTLWSRSLGEEFGMISPYGGRTHPPALFEDLVIVNAVIVGWGDTSRPAHRILALDKETGEPRWFTGTKPLPEDTIYSTPFFTVLDGQAVMVIGSADGSVWALQPRTGKSIWNFKMSPRGINTSPVVVGDKVFASQAEENLDRRTMGSLVCFQGAGEGDITETNEVWRVPRVTAGKSSPLVVDGRVYSADDSGNLHIVDAETGKRIGNRPVKLVGTIVRSSPLYADGKIYLCSLNAWHVMQPTPGGVKFLAKMRLPIEDEVSGSMAVSHGKIYLPTGGALYCLGKKDAKPSATPIPEGSKEQQSPSNKPTFVQISPCEVLLNPGEQQRFDVRLFNAAGQQIVNKNADAEVTFEVRGPGNVGADRTYTAPSGNLLTVVTVDAKLGNTITGRARVRIIPPLPWKFDFNDIQLATSPSGQAEGEAPLTWIGARHRHKIREKDGEKVMVKVTTIPKGTRSQCWFGPSDLHDYTIQADLCGQNNNGKLPDMGVIAQRYTLDMMGASQQLQIRYWPPQVARQFSKTIPFEWKGDTWYTMKFQASTEGDNVVLRGKVWPRDSSEPEAWTIETEDHIPNLQGSPGLFGNATTAEIYIDNIRVTPNETASASP